MKQKFALSALFVAAGLMGSLFLATAAERKPLQPLAEMICEQGMPFPSSELFELFELEIPFLMLMEGPDMMAMPASQCRNFRPAENEPFFLVLGHRGAKGTATFFVTSLRGEIIQTARGQTATSGDSTFVAVDVTDEIRAEFEAAKSFWLTTCGDLAVN